MSECEETKRELSLGPKMAEGGFGSTGAVRHYEGKVTAFVVVTCIVAATGGLIFGYDIGISGGVTSMDVFLKKFFPDVHRKQSQTTETSQYCKFDSQLLTLFTSSLYLAALIASFFAYVVTRIHGRKISMFIGGLVFLCGSILNAAAVNLPMLIIGRILLGIGVGFANQSVPLYLSEMAPAQIRGALNIGFQVAVTTGNLVANVINYGTSKIAGGWGWRISLGLAAVPALILTLGSILLPDTPASILERGHPERAKQMLIKIRGTNNVEEELEDMHEASEAAKIVENPWRNILQTKYRPQLVFCIFIPFFQQFTGINVIMFYAPVLFKTLGFGGEASLLSSVLTGGVNLACTFISVFTVDKFGRRGLFLEGGVQMVVAQVAVAVMIGHVFGTTGTGSFTKAQADVLLLFICIYVAAFAWSWGPLGWLVPSEICPLEIRSAAQALNVSVNMLFTFLVAQFFVSCLCHMKFGLFLFFAGFVIIMTIFIYFLFPETKNVPIEEIELVWKEHWFWGSFIPDDALHPYPPNIQLHSKPVV